MAEPSFTLTRQQAERLLYEGLSTLRFTQDTPVMPDVWLGYAQAPHDHPSLLITPLQNGRGELASPGKLSVVIQERLQRNRSTAAWKQWKRKNLPANVVYNRTAVNAELWFDEVVRVLLPLSRWWESRIAPLPDDSPLNRLNDADPEVRRKNRDFVVQALMLAGQRVSDQSLEEATAAARRRAESVFEAPPEDESPDSAASAEASQEQRTSAAAIVDHQSLQTRRYFQRYRQVAGLAASTSAHSGRDEQVDRLVAQPDILWMVRIVGTLGGLVRQIPEISRLPILGDSPAMRKRSEYVAQLETYYRAVVDVTADLMLDLDRLNEPKTEEKGKKAAAEPVRIYSVSTCRKATPSISMSRATVNADAAVQLFGIDCRSIAWAVVDSGIDATHPAFLSRETLTSRVVATYDFTLFRDLLREGGKNRRSGNLPKRLQALFDRVDAKMATDLRIALQSGRELDWPTLIPFIRVPHTKEDYSPPLQEHGTHVAGIIGADCPDGPGELFRGLCPEIRLYDFRVLDDNGEGDEFNVMAALQLIRYLNAHRDVPAIHGVNLSLSIPHDVANFACGRTPICGECERLVNSGVVVVVAAGNEGYLEFQTTKGPRDTYRNISITDPGNAEAVITVGATHRFQPHTYGVSYFSSRGPTGDGRSKPDLVAPGEKIHSTVPGGDYKPMDGTSMAAPHVSGAAALLLARHRELIGQPARIKAVLCNSATDLGRERYFQGSGMLDILRALQSI